MREKVRERVLITGSKGKIGLAITSAIKETHDVVEIDTNVSNPDNTTIFATDITDLPVLKEVFKKAGPFTSVIHLAGNPNESAKWGEILGPNIIGVKNIYECAREFRVGKVVFASSTHILGGYKGYPQTSPLGRLITVADPPRPDGDYGTSKGFGELVARQYFDFYGIRSICLRIGSLTANNRPFPPYDRVWLSHRDAAQVFIKALESEIDFGIYFATSDNKDLPYDITPTKIDLGFNPQDGV